ncbi:MAG: alpha-glucan family phosphorylase [Hymenobacteraceae bacterium]|nr:alpha-glucan family phosphorylase [Hymenobacteraceae bacterium]
MAFQFSTYLPAAKYRQRVAYFSMEFALDQALKNYSGGLGFLAGSHMRSAYDLKQNVIGVGILWSFGYYDQGRNEDQSLRIDYVQKNYSFLKDTGVVFPITIHDSPVHVKAYVLEPETFGTAPMVFLTTDLPENDYLSRTISHHLYDADTAARIAQSILLGVGGAEALDRLGLTPELYHLNEGHGLPLGFWLLGKHGGPKFDVAEVQRRLVFTTHTPELAGNEEHAVALLGKMSFFGDVPLKEAVKVVGTTTDGSLNYTLTALRLSKRANAVSQVHGRVANEMWGTNAGICPIIAITNSQNGPYWRDPALAAALKAKDNAAWTARKRQMKEELFREVANQTGTLLDPDKLTLVWARRFAQYKRADLIIRDFERFRALVEHADRPVQVIWAGKPYPKDYGAISLFNELIRRSRLVPNCAVLTGYELGLSRLLKNGSDLWLNTPRYPREASGTSGMTAAMNGSVSVSIPDGWIPEFAKDGKNCFLISIADESLSTDQKDAIEADNLLTVLEQQVVPMYYDRPAAFLKICQAAQRDVEPMFESARMAREYYERLYTA